MDSVDKLRTAAQLLEITDMRPSLYEIADEIEREIERDFMRLPRDANDEPIRVGDVVSDDAGVSKVVAVTASCYVDELGYMNAAAECTHRHPPTVEDVLRDYAFEAHEIYIDQRIGGEDRADALGMLAAKAADKLREAIADD